MSIEPPPTDDFKKSSILEGDDEDSDDLFASAISDSSKVTKKAAAATVQIKEEVVVSEATSGYDSKTVDDVVRSDTMEDVTQPISLDDDDDDLFKSARIEPEPSKHSSNGGGASSGSLFEPIDDDQGGRDIPLEDDDEKPFQDAHLKPQLQLSGDNSSAAAPFVNAPEEEAMIDQEPAAAAQSTSSFSGGGGQTQITSSLKSFPEDEENDEFVDITVTSPHKVGEGMSSYMVYNVQTKTNINYFKKKEMSVNRRFSDFLGLHDKLSEKYLPNGRIIPPAPDKSVVGMTKVKMSKESGGESGQDEFVERRRAALERFLNRTATYSSLRTDPDFREFLELETELPKAHQTAALSSRSMMKLINKFGDSLTNITTKLEETDDWFEDKNGMIEQLELQLRKLHASTENLVELRKGLAASTLGLSKSLAVLSGSEENSGLSAAVSQLSSVHEKIASVHNEQASAEFYELSELIKDYLGLIAAVKDIMHERVKAWQAWQGATSTLTKKREAKARSELQQKFDKVAILRQEIAEMERQQDMAQENFDRISRLIKKEVDAFQLKKVKDFKISLAKYFESMLVAQDQIASEWERYLPEIQQVSL